jgi:hypothetical protein
MTLKFYTDADFTPSEITSTAAHLPSSYSYPNDNPGIANTEVACDLCCTGGDCCAVAGPGPASGSIIPGPQEHKSASAEGGNYGKQDHSGLADNGLVDDESPADEIHGATDGNQRSELEDDNSETGDPEVALQCQDAQQCECLTLFIEADFWGYSPNTLATAQHSMNPPSMPPSPQMWT